MLTGSEPEPESAEVRALRDGMPGVHSWFSLASQEQAAAGVRHVVLAEVLRRVAELSGENTVALAEVTDMIQRMDRR